MEEQYLDLCRRVLEDGEKREDRTGTGTISTFTSLLSCDLRDGFPLLTTKRMSWKSVVAEQLWFISGSTDSKILEDQGVRIWKGNSSKEFIERQGLNWREGDLGPIYGHQFRHAGAKYTGADSIYDGLGIDQLANLVNSLKKNPQSRRHIVTSWSAADIDHMALPPCHSLPIQCYVSNDGHLDLTMYQRSGDLFLGVPFNIASTALLLHELSQWTGYRPRRYTHIIGDTHIYLDHIDQVKIQINRIPYHPPSLTIDDCTLDTITKDCIHLSDYKYHPAITAKMSI
jgi:thymidylate synthase